MEQHVYQLLSLITEKNGYQIDSIPIEKKTRFGRTTTIAKYNYIKPLGEYIQNQLWQ